MVTVIIVFALIALFCIAFEEVIHLNKAKSTLFLGCLSWCLLFVHAATQGKTEHIKHMLDENLLDIASLWLFLMATMTFVAYLNARGLVGDIVSRILPGELSFRQLTLLLALFSVVLSMLCDNITATLVSIGVVQAFKLDVKERIKLCVLVVFAVNSGGVILITGDVTTLMIFSEGHVTIGELLGLLIPTLIGVGVLAASMSIGASRRVSAEVNTHSIERLDVVIAVLFFSTIVCTMIFNIFFGIPPVLTFLMGLSIMFLIGGFVNKYHQEVHLLEYVRQIQFDTLMFFLGILLIVGALKEVGILVWVTEFYLSVDPSFSSFSMGILSSVLDNVPLTAALLKANPALTNAQWLCLTYAVGVGGSLLVIGSAAGIVAMSKVRELTFMQYARFIPQLLAAYTAGYVATLLLAS
ncbi:MAG: sodium:proton antiporter NhaD [Marinagarivorans sp.]|nr:sodium:proton antiporter NhaD [Marinagarivorans sp.]